MFRPTRVIVLALALALVALPGCSRIEVVYRSADLVLSHYADDYLNLDSRQLARWEPRLKTALAAHRAEELPKLAAFFDEAWKASLSGFDERSATCLATGAEAIYRDHARIAVRLAAPLLAELSPKQIDALERRFAVELADDQPKPGTDPAHEKRKRMRRYAKATEEWTGKLEPPQQEVVIQVVGRMPDTSQDMLDYRTRKRAELIALLRTGADEARVQAFLSDWLVEFRDMPPALEQAGKETLKGVEELLIRLGAALDQKQREQLQRRLKDMRDDLLELQAKPRLEPLSC